MRWRRKLEPPPRIGPGVVPPPVPPYTPCALHALTCVCEDCLVSKGLTHYHYETARKDSAFAGSLEINVDSHSPHAQVIMRAINGNVAQIDVDHSELLKLARFIEGRCNRDAR